MAQDYGGVSAAPARQSGRTAAHAADSSTPLRRGITPEVFHRFMTYEHNLSEHASTPSLPAPAYSTSSPTDSLIHQHVAPSRAIRRIPRKMYPASSTAAHRPNQPSTAPSPTSHSLSHELEQLQLSSHDEHQARATSAASFSRSSNSQQDSSPTSQTSAAQFRFPSLPLTLTDQAFHQRQRAAHFILLCSQQMDLEHLPMLSRLAMPLHARTSRSKASARPDSYDPLSTNLLEHGSDREGDDTSSCCYATGRHHSDDEGGEHLDVDACRSAHPGNKKKRKSSRVTNPGIATVKTNSAAQEKQHDPASYASYATPPLPSTHVRNRVLADKTNLSGAVGTSAQDAAVSAGNKQIAATSADALSSSDLSNTFIRLPQRMPGSEHRKTMLRARIRARLAQTYHKRTLQMEGRDLQQRLSERAPHPGLDVSTLPLTTPERKATSKRVNKAGKRAQAIRGGSSPAKPLTIAEIRAKAAAAAGSAPIAVTHSARTVPTPSQSRASTSVDANDHLRNSQSPSAPKTPPRNPESARLDSTSSRRKSLANDILASSNSVPKASAARSAQTAPSTPAKSTAIPTFSLPSSPFEFRMSSAVTLRLRELRSQLDAASSKASHTAQARDTQAMARIYSEALATPCKDAGRPLTNEAATRGDDVPTAGSLSRPAPRPPHGSSTTVRQHQQQASLEVPRTSPAPVVTNDKAKAKTKATSARRSGGRKSAASSTHKHTSGCHHGLGAHHGTGSALFTADDWICVFCEYELYYGEEPLMLRACRSRKKQVEKKNRAKSKLQTALQKKAGIGKGMDGACQHGHHQDGQGCEHTHDEGCHYDRASSYGSDECCHDHDYDHHHHHHHRDGGDLNKHDGHHQGDDDRRERCDCGNSIHSSDFDDEEK